MRLDKFLAHAGIGTRKEVKEFIRKKRVSVNGVIQKKDDVKIDELKDEVCVDGAVIRYQQFVYYMLKVLPHMYYTTVRIFRLDFLMYSVFQCKPHT